MKRLYRLTFEIMPTNPGQIQQISVHMEAYNFEAAVESAKLYVKKHLSAYADQRILGVEEIGEVTAPDAP